MSTDNNLENNISNEDVAAFGEWMTSPLKYVKDVWGLEPQPAKPEYQDYVDKMMESGQFKKIKPEHFGSFEWTEVNNTLPEKEKSSKYDGWVVKIWKWYDFQSDDQNFKNCKHISWQQAIFLKAVELIKRGVISKRKITCLSGHGTGKTCVLSWLAFWFADTQPGSKMGCTAPTSLQLHDILWDEMKGWKDRMPDWMKYKHRVTSDKMFIDEDEKWKARARTADKDHPEALAGLHGGTVSLVVDEASDVHINIFITVKGSLTNKNIYVLLISNGTRSEGYFYLTHTKFADQFICLRFNSEESPLVTAKYCADWLIDCDGDRDDDIYRVRVSGLFPKIDSMDDSGYSLLHEEDWIEKIDDNSNFEFQKLGVDPSGEGVDNSAWVVRNSLVAKVEHLEKKSNDKSIANKTKTIQSKYNIPNSKVFVDNFGVGADVSQEILMASPVKERVNGVNVGEKGQTLIDKGYTNSQKDIKQFANLKALCCWRARRWLKQGGALVGNHYFTKFKDEIMMMKFRTNEQGKIEIIKKKDLIKEGKKSPNIYDAFILTFATDDENDIEEYYKPSEQTKQIEQELVNQLNIENLNEVFNQANQF